jgi:hypothetical protein
MKILTLDQKLEDNIKKEILFIKTIVNQIRNNKNIAKKYLNYEDSIIKNEARKKLDLKTDEEIILKGNE